MARDTSLPRSSFMTRFGLQVPIVQAPMAGGGDTPALVAAVGKAGGMGFIAGAYRTAEQIVEAGRAVKAASDRPFGVNLFAPLEVPDPPNDVGAAVARVQPFYDALEIAPPEPSAASPYVFEEQLVAALAIGASALSFTFGLLPAPTIAQIKARGLYLIGTATTVEEAVALENSGVDAIVAQGSEAGGHRGSFLGDFLGDVGAAMIGTMALVPQIVDAVSVPVLASGGIMDGRGIAAALMLGADAAQMGTAFLVCEEAGVPDAYKAAILNASEDETRVTRAFSGRPARGIVNRAMREIEGEGPQSDTPQILPFPYQNALTRPLRAEAARQGRAEFLSLWAGQGLRLAKRQSAAALMGELTGELQALLGTAEAGGATP